MKTIIELYDERSILNLLAVCSFEPEPENVVFIGEFPDRKRTAMIKGWVDGFLSRRGIKTKTHFRDVCSSDYKAILDVLYSVDKEFPDCALEVCGGGYLLLLAAGIFAERRSIPIFHYNIEIKRFENIRDMPEADSLREPSFTAGDMLALSHAGAIGHGHFSTNELDLSVRSDARELWNIFLGYRSVWHKTMLFFQKAKCDDEEQLSVDTSRNIIPEVYVQDDLFRDLERGGLITNLIMSESRVKFRYKNKTVRAALRDAGAALELFTYTAIKKNPDMFNDCEINLCVDWDGDGPSQTNNEVDIIAVSGVTPLFISCKSGRLENSFLNEIYTISYRLGGMFAKPVLMTGALYPGTDNKAIMQRGQDLGIEEITISDICDKIKDNMYNGINSCRFCPTRECENNLADLLYRLCE